MQQTTSLRIHQAAIVVLLILLIWKWYCGNVPCPKITEAVRIDTTHSKVIDSSKWTINPDPIKEGGRIADDLIPTKTIPVMELPGNYVSEPGYQIIDTQAIVSDYLKQHDYSKSYSFQNGTIVVENTVGANKLLKQRVLPTFDITEITKTITQSEAKSGQLYVGIDGLGNQNTPLFGFGGSFMYKTKKDRVFEIGAVALKDNGIMYRAGVKFLLSFHK